MFLLKGEEIMNLNTAIKELEKEKVLRTSLFKMTHEIKNPIAVCKGYLDMLDLSDEKKVNKYIPIIRSEIERTLSLMDDFLDYTKVKVNKDVADIYMLLDEVITSLNLFFKENNITLKMNLPDDELFLEIDYNRIKQVIVNILKNCHEAYDERKREMVISIKTRKRKNYFEILIEDNGIGMDRDTLNNVTDLFFTTKRNGTGLGTSLSKEIMELHGGKIKYLSELGIGTIVILSFPLNDKILS
jgi:two-component system sporulation sensor kinase B